MQKNCIVVGAGAYYNKLLPVNNNFNNSFIIAVDGGYHHLKEMGINPDIVLGDFDSFSGEIKHPNVIRLQPEKDDTDMLAALKYGLQRGFQRFDIYGGTGGRIDHTFANIQCLSYLAQHHVQGFLMSNDCMMTCIHNTTMDFDHSYQGIISVFSLSDHSSGVCLDGLKYPLYNADLTNTYPLGVSNEFTGAASKVTVQNGTLLIIFPYK